MKTGVSITSDALADTVKAIQALTRKQVLIGIPAAAASREDGFSNAAIGYLNEMGSPAQNIPARPHLLPGIRAATPKIVTLMKETATAAMQAALDQKSADRRDADIDKSLTKVGLLCVDSVRQVIRAGIPPPLADSTLHSRQTRKVAPRTGTTPLIDTGAYFQALTFVLDTRELGVKGVAPTPYLETQKVERGERPENSESTYTKL